MYLGNYYEGERWGQYHFLQGMGADTNKLWVDNYQNPFNKNVLEPAAALAQTNKPGAYAMLAPAFAKIQNDAAAFVQQYGSQGQKTIDGWHKDFPLIQGFLADWGMAAQAATTAPAGSTAPVSLPLAFDQQPAVYGGQPSIIGPGLAPGAATAALPAGSPIVNVSTGAVPAGMVSTIEEWAPWIAGAAMLGLLLSRGKAGPKGASQNRPRRRRRGR